MATEIKSETCTRQRVPIEGENYYLAIGDAFVIPTCPRENDPAMGQIRKVVETLCAEITRVMEMRLSRRIREI